MSGSALFCPVCDAGPFDYQGDRTRHLADVHGTSYDLATGATLTQDECELLGLDGRDGRGTYTLADLDAGQRSILWAHRWANR